MPDNIDWTLATHDGNRRRQHEEFRALSFRDKLMRIEELGEVVAYFESRRIARAARVVNERPASPRPSGGENIARGRSDHD